MGTQRFCFKSTLILCFILCCLPASKVVLTRFRRVIVISVSTSEGNLIELGLPVAHHDFYYQHSKSHSQQTRKTVDTNYGHIARLFVSSVSPKFLRLGYVLP